MTTVVIAAASPSARAGLEAVLARDDGLRVVAAVHPDAAFTVALDSGPPDVVLLELGDIADATDLGAAVPRPDGGGPAVVLLANTPGPAMAAEALRGGARAVLRWDASPDEIVAAVRAVAAGLVALPGDLAAELAASANGGAAAGTRDRAVNAPPLTAREREVLAMIAEGLGNKTIGRRLGISDHTVKTHVAALFAKLGVSNRTEAVAVGVRRGLVVL